MTGLRLGGAQVRAPRQADRGRWLGAFGVLMVAMAAGWGTKLVFARFGPDGFMVALAIILGLVVYSLVSFRNLAVPFFVWLVVIGGFRFLWAIQTPVLPDMTLDRITLAWLTVVVMVKFVVERRRLLRLGMLDALLVVHGIYILVRVAMDDMFYFRFWSMSILIPYAVFFFAKNIVVSMRLVRSLMVILLALGVYYNVTAVAEKLSIDWLLWPSYMRTPAGEFIGRSAGPFRQAPLFGTIVGMMLPLHFYFFGRTRSNVARALLFVSLMSGMAGLYFTYTRGSWLAGFAAIAVTVLLNRKKFMPVALASVAVAGFMAVVVLGIGQDKFMKERVENQDTLETRIGIAVTALRVWRNEPVFGAGFFQYRQVYDDYLEPTEVPGYGTVRLRQVRGNSLHDIYLGPLAEDGLVGFGMQVWIWVLLLGGLWRRWRRSASDDEFCRLVLPVFAGIYVGYLVGGLAIDYRYFSFVGALFYMAAGVQDGYDPERGGLTGDLAERGAT